MAKNKKMDDIIFVISVIVSLSSLISASAELSLTRWVLTVWGTAYTILCFVLVAGLAVMLIMTAIRRPVKSPPGSGGPKNRTAQFLSNSYYSCFCTARAMVLPMIFGEMGCAAAVLEVTRTANDFTVVWLIAPMTIVFVCTAVGMRWRKADASIEAKNDKRAVYAALTGIQPEE